MHIEYACWRARARPQQEDTFTAQLADATKALEESQEQLRVLNEKWEQILAEKEYLQVSTGFFFLWLESLSLLCTCPLSLASTYSLPCLSHSYPLSPLRTQPPALSCCLSRVLSLFLWLTVYRYVCASNPMRSPSNPMLSPPSPRRPPFCFPGAHGEAGI
jgi:hypothetical protein